MNVLFVIVVFISSAFLLLSFCIRYLITIIILRTSLLLFFTFYILRRMQGILKFTT